MGITPKNIKKRIRNMLYIFNFISIFPGTTDQILHTGNIARCPLSIYEKTLRSDLTPFATLEYIINNQLIIIDDVRIVMFFKLFE
jgi:hypothetical protein